MNENDRTTLEQAIYEEMELTPEMIRSIRTLCGVCLCSFVESKAFKIAIVPSADRSMDHSDWISEVRTDFVSFKCTNASLEEL